MDMSNVLSGDYEYYDMCYDISTTEKRVVTANVKTYETTGSYVTIKLFKKEAERIGYRLNQKITLTILEVEQISSQFDKIRDATEAKTLTNSKEKEKVMKNNWSESRNKLSANKKPKAEPEDTNTEVE